MPGMAPDILKVASLYHDQSTGRLTSQSTRAREQAHMSKTRNTEASISTFRPTTRGGADKSLLQQVIRQHKQLLVKACACEAFSEWRWAFSAG